MPTTQKTQQTGNFAPGQLENLQNLQGISVPLISGWMQNPTGNPFFQQQQALGTQQAGRLNATGASDITRNLTSGGFGGASSPFAAEMMANQGRAATGLQSQLGFQNPMGFAQQLYGLGAQLAQGYRPFQTGQTQTQSTQGLGTWLPQVANLGLGLATGGMSLPFTSGISPFMTANNFGGMSQMQPWAGGGAGAFGEGGGAANFGYTPGASPGGQGMFGGLPTPPSPLAGGGGDMFGGGR